MLRGWDITYMPVWRGFVVTIIWIVITYAIFKELVNNDKVSRYTGYRSITIAIWLFGSKWYRMPGTTCTMLQETGKSGWIARQFLKIKSWLTCKRCC